MQTYTLVACIVDTEDNTQAMYVFTGNTETLAQRISAAVDGVLDETGQPNEGCEHIVTNIAAAVTETCGAPGTPHEYPEICQEEDGYDGAGFWLALYAVPT